MFYYLVIVDIDGQGGHWSKNYFGKAQDWPTQILVASIGPVYVWVMII